MSAVSFFLYLLVQAFILTVTWMGTSVAAVLVLCIGIPAVLAIWRFRQRGWHGLRSVPKEYGKVLHRPVEPAELNRR
jgi:hypothetical protein